MSAQQPPPEWNPEDQPPAGPPQGDGWQQTPGYGQPPGYGQAPGGWQQATGPGQAQSGWQQPPGYGQPQGQGQWPQAAGMPPGYPAPFGYDPQGRPYSDKSKITAGLLQLFLGSVGAGRWYTGHSGIALGQLFTCGGCGIWSLIDAIMILTGDQTDSQGRVLRG